MSSLFGIGANGASGDFYNGQISQSLRFDGSTSKLTRTPSSSGNQKKWTTSFWLKRTELGVAHYLWSGGNYSGNDGIAAIYFANDDKLHTYFDTSGTNPYGAVNDRVYRDTSAWYHIVWAVDAENTVQRIWVNGVEETLNSGNNPPNFAYGMNRAGTLQAFGIAAWGGLPDLDGYLAEIVHLDGQYLDETYFGEFKNGVWIPIEITGLTFGTNGFHLSFADSSSIGDDISGNANDFTPTGVNDYDVVPDSPENNFATICPLSSSPATFSEGNLKFNGSNLTGNTNQGISSGNFYAEVYVNAGSNWYIGVLDISGGLNPNRGGSWTSTGAIAYKANGDQYSLPLGGSSATASYGASYTTGDIIGIAVDVDADTITFYKNGVSQGNTTNGVSHISSDGVYGVLIYGTSSTLTVNFGQDSTFAGATTAGGNTDANGIGDFKYSVPSGYLALCSANLPEPTIGPNSDTQADDNFNVEFYNGNNDATRTFDIGFVSDFAWFASFTGSYGHQLYDSTRGVQKYLRSHANIAEVTNTEGVLDFDDNGLLKIGTDAFLNESGTNMMIWNWKANGGTTSTISADTYSSGVPSVASTVQANTDAGFSIVTFPANNTEGTKVGHGLGKTPKMIITKQIPAISSWYTYHASLGNNYYVRLNNTNTQGEVSNSTIWGSADPDDNVFTIGNSTTGYNNGGANDALAYCFAEIEGYSKFGSFIGNGSTDGTFINLGFRPKFFMMFLVSSASLHLWLCYNSTKDTDNPLASEIYFSGQSVDGETSFSLGDFVSNGVKLRNNNSARNPSGGEFIYMAFAENPFKYANAR